MSRLAVAALIALALAMPAMAKPICKASTPELAENAIPAIQRDAAAPQATADLRARRVPLPSEAVAPFGLLFLLALQEGLAIR